MTTTHGGARGGAGRPPRKDRTMPEQTRTTVYLTEQDRQRLARLKERYGLGVSAAVRAGLALLERKLEARDRLDIMQKGEG